tara:strand:- start:327 stop:1994 length:1668 start_codon:yes stop_codon:yes gene_type:complete
MSKYDSISRGELGAATSVRIQSLAGLRKDFDCMHLNSEGQFYDDRTYYASGREYSPYMFSKTLVHDATTGFPLKDDVKKVVCAYMKGSESVLNDVPRHPDATRKLEGIASSQSFNLIGTDPSATKFNGVSPIDSVQTSFEMAEVYAMGLMRDIPFHEIQNGAVSAEDQATMSMVLGDLNTYSDKTTHPVDPFNKDITGATLFRGAAQDELAGPYISQFLMLDYNYGNLEVEQKYLVEDDFGESTTWAGWLAIQNGITGAQRNFQKEADGTTNKKRYVYTPRVLGSKVHNDPLYQFYYQAALIALGPIGASAFDHPKTSAWTSGGGPDILSAVAGVALGALRTAWYHKWGVNMTVRPEVMAARIHLAKTNETYLQTVPGLADIRTHAEKMSNILEAIRSKNLDGTYLLPLMFSEGSPTHPSFPAGHATVSGACVTVLKAMLKTHDGNNDKLGWPLQAVESRNGTELEDVADATGMTIVGELNKLASNVAIGRNVSGVHYRCDGDCGMVLGEQYAITYLTDKCKEYQESVTGLFRGFVLEKFDGEVVRITSEGPTPL